jgi:HEPN domain-containing protein
VNAIPPKTHDLMFIYRTAKIEMPQTSVQFIEDMNVMTVLTRYPESLDEILRQFSKEATGKIIENTRAVLSWLETY